MSDKTPFKIQMEIVKKVFDVKSLIRFRSVSKPWKSFIDSSEFVNGYGARHTQPHSSILSMSLSRSLSGSKDRFMCLVDDDKNETFKVQKEFVASSLVKQYPVSYIVGACHGLLCLYAFHIINTDGMVVLWNPSIQKSVGISVLPSITTTFGFGVCPVTRDPTVVKFTYPKNMPWHVEVFTLSSGVWNVIPTGNLPCDSPSSSFGFTNQVVIDRFIYWGAYDTILADDGELTRKFMVVSFDLITMEFKVVDLPDTLTKEVLRFMYPHVKVLKEVLQFMFQYVKVSKLRGSLVVYGTIYVDGAQCCDVWGMEHDSSFRKLFTIPAPVDKILGFSKSGQAIFERPNEGGRLTTLDVYDPCSQQIKNLEISGVEDSFFMGSYKESLLLLDHSDLHIYSDDS